MKYVRYFLGSLILLITSCSSGDTRGEDGVIVSAQWLQEQLDDSSVTVLHVGSREVYDSIHIAGAQFLDPYDFVVRVGDLRNELPEVDTLMKLLGQVGVKADSKVVLYFESVDMITRTARMFLTLDHMGLGEQSYVLNGGLTAWTELGLATSSTPAEPGKMANRLRAPGEKQVTIQADELNQQRWNPEYVIIDARSADEYYGEIDSTERTGSGGHVEGAYSLDYHELLSDTAPTMFKDDEALKAAFDKAGLDQRKTAVFYCGSGVRASLNYLVARHLGYPALLYDGSIQEWESLKLPQTSPVLDPSLND